MRERYKYFNYSKKSYKILVFEMLRKKTNENLQQNSSFSGNLKETEHKSENKIDYIMKSDKLCSKEKQLLRSSQQIQLPADQFD